jgi:hypothetical protein
MTAPQHPEPLAFLAGSHQSLGLCHCGDEQHVDQHVAYMLIPFVTAEQDPFMLLKDKCCMLCFQHFTVQTIHQQIQE